MSTVGPWQHNKHNQTFPLQNCIRGFWHCQRARLENVELAGIKELLLPVKGENSQRSANPKHTHSYSPTESHTLMRTPNYTPIPIEMVLKPLWS